MVAASRNVIVKRKRSAMRRDVSMAGNAFQLPSMIKDSVGRTPFDCLHRVATMIATRETVVQRLNGETCRQKEETAKQEAHPA